MGWEDIILLSLFELSREHEWFPESITVNGPAQYTQYIQQLTTTARFEPALLRASRVEASRFTLVRLKCNRAKPLSCCVSSLGWEIVQLVGRQTLVIG